MNILLVEPFYGGSHKSWSQGLIKHSSHNVDVITMEALNWKWRMEGGAITLADLYLKSSKDYDLILVSDIVNLPLFVSLTKEKLKNTPVVVYFHENQLTYPVSYHDKKKGRGRDLHFGFINFSSALLADKVFFNSQFHMDEFFNALGKYLESKFDYNELEKLELIKNKSSVLPLGMDFKYLDDTQVSVNKCRTPLILWNHRWESDKNPEQFIKLLFDLDDKGLEFEVCILGEDTYVESNIFHEVRTKMEDKILQLGFVEDYSEYLGWLKMADILPVTSHHDFFGCSVVEAIRAGVYPVLPMGLAYPEHLPVELHKDHYYKGYNELLDKVEYLLDNVFSTRDTDLSHHMDKYSWQNLIVTYDKEFSKITDSLC